MKYAWIENDRIRDVCDGDPATRYHPTVAALYTELVPDDVVNGATLVDGEWVNPPPPPAPAPAPPVVPQEVTRRQAKQALLLAGMLGSVQPAIDAIPNATQRALVQIEWDDSQVFERDRPALVSLAGALGLDDAALDALFVAAAGL